MYMQHVDVSPSFSATGSDECLILYGDSDGCINILVINSVGECLRFVIMQLINYCNVLFLDENYIYLEFLQICDTS